MSEFFLKLNAYVQTVTQKNINTYILDTLVHISTVSTDLGWTIRQKDLPKNVRVHGHGRDHDHDLHDDHVSASVHPLQPG